MREQKSTRVRGWKKAVLSAALGLAAVSSISVAASGQATPDTKPATEQDAGSIGFKSGTFGGGGMHSMWGIRW